ncbi:MAG: triose-phosphate isomerase [Planctomycetota bacterium]
MPRRPFIAGNWKMNTDAASGVELAKAVASQAAASDGVDVLVAPPFPYLHAIKAAVADTPLLVGSQNVWHEPSGAYTGEVSVGMLADVGCSHAILGHSERRVVLGEDDALINKKVHATLAGGLGVILCVGELLEEREAGDTEKVVETQLTGSLAGVTAEQMTAVTIAYEPVWAIGTGKTATPEQAQEVHAFVRGKMADAYGADVADAVRIQYGGSVKPANAAELLGQPDIDGALVGGASLKAETFLPIIDAA